MVLYFIYIMYCLSYELQGFSNGEAETVAKSLDIWIGEDDPARAFWSGGFPETLYIIFVLYC